MLYLLNNVVYELHLTLIICISVLIHYCSCFQMTFGEQNTEKESHDILSYAFEQGINILDTAEAVSVSFSSFCFVYLEEHTV